MPTNPRLGRTELLSDATRTKLLTEMPDVVFRPAPDPDIPAGDSSTPVWRVRFEMVSDSSRRFGLDINGEVILGRGGSTPKMIDMTPYDAELYGVSRRHVMLRPTATNLFVIDMASTNGSMRNGRSIGIRTPYPLIDGDILSLGKLQLSIRILDRPHIYTAPLRQKELSLAESLSQIAKAITSQLDLDEVMHQVAATAMSLTKGSEAAIWLVDQLSGEMFLEVERGVDDERVQRKRLPLQDDSLVAKVVQTGKPVRVNHRPGQTPIQLTTGYLVEAAVHVPITLGGVTFGVLSVMHREAGNAFDEKDEQLLTAVADFAAIAIQNARLFQATDKALELRVRELSALNEVARAVSSSLDLDRVYEVLVDEVSKYCPVEWVEIYLRERSELALLSLGHANYRQQPVAFGDGIIGTVAQRGQAIVTNEAAVHEKFNPRVDSLNGVPAQTLACMPLRIQDRVVGVLALHNRMDGPFTDEDVDLLASFANPVATAVENARLFEESERQRAAIQATAETISQPLMLLDDLGNLLVSNKAANHLLETSMAETFDAISSGVGLTKEVPIGEKTYLSTTQHLPDVGTIIVMQDITYVKQLEQDRSEFMHMLSHDLKNPIMAITGWSSLLERSMILDDESGRFLEEINIAADRMLNMINHLLTTVNQDDAVQLIRKPCDLVQIVQQVMEDVQGAALHKSITIDFKQTGKPYLALADELRLYHMVLNLVDNAIKYSPAETLVTVMLAYAPEEITIRVQDEGSGIPEHDLELIFNKYFRSANKDEASGTGVGLAAVRAIVQAHGGAVKAENRPDRRGAVFTLTLPGTLRTTEQQL